MNIIKNYIKSFLFFKQVIIKQLKNIENYLSFKNCVIKIF